MRQEDGQEEPANAGSFSLKENGGCSIKYLFSQILEVRVQFKASLCLISKTLSEVFT